MNIKKFLIPLCALCASAGAVFAQATTQVTPREYFVLSNVNLPGAATLNTTTMFSTNNFPAWLGGVPANWPATLPVGAYTNTFMPFSGAHAIGITVIIGNSHAVAPGAINMGIFPAYDTSGGNSNSINGRFGQLFGPQPLLTWSVTGAASSTNVFTTNIAASAWEPATSLGYTFTNASVIGTNLTITVIQSTVP